MTSFATDTLKTLNTAVLSAAMLLFLCSEDVSSQEQAEWRFFGVTEGLADSWTIRVSVDLKGQVWVCHGDVDQLSWMNGWPLPDGKFVWKISEPDEEMELQERGSGRFWAFSPATAYLFRKGNWERCSINEIDSLSKTDDESIQEVNYRTLILPKEKDQVYYLLPEYLTLFNTETREKEIVIKATDTNLGRFIDINMSRDGDIWLGAEKGIASLKLQSGSTRWQLQTFPLLKEGLKDFQTFSFGANEELTAVGLDARNGRKKLIHFDGSKWKAVQGYQGNVIKGWRGLEDSYWAVKERQTLSLIHDGKEEVQEKTGILSGELHDVAIQTNGVFWLATSHGLARYAPPIWRTPSQVKHIDNRIHSICEDSRGRLWFAAVYHLMSFQNGQWKIYPLPRNMETPPNFTQSLCNLPNGCIAIGTIPYQDSLLTFDPEKEEFILVSHISKAEAEKSGVHYIRLIAPRKDGRIFVETHPGRDSADFGLEIYDGESFKPFLDVQKDWNIQNLRYLCETEDGDLWIGGILSNTIKLYSKGKIRSFSVADGYNGGGVVCICEIGKNRIWVGGRDHILEYDGERWSVVRSGLATVRSIVKGRDGIVWVASGTGIHRYFNGSWVTNSTEDGLPNTAVFSVFQDSRGQVWAGTIGGLSLHHPEADTDPPLAYISEKENLIETPPAGEVRLIFSGADRWMQTRSDRLMYSYRLDGQEWSGFRTGTVAMLNRLPYGRHRFEVKAMDVNLNISPQPAAFEFTVLAPWYKEPGFQITISAGGVIILILLGYAVHRHVLLEKLVVERTRDLQQKHASLEVMLKHKSLLAAIASRLSSAVSFEKAIEEIMTSISEKMGLDKACLIEPSLNDRLLEKQENIFTDEDSVGQGEKAVQSCSVDPWIIQQIKTDGSFVCSSVLELEPEKRENFLKQRVDAVCILPVLIEGQAVRLVCFGKKENYCWKPEELEFFQTATDIITNAWERFCHFQARIEAEKKQSESIQMAEKAARLASIGVIAAGITHEINQPLNDIKAVSDTVFYWIRKNAGIIPGQYEKMLLSISGSVGRISKIISQMRSYWSSPNGTSRETICLNKAAHNALSLVHSQLDSHGINLAIDEKDKNILIEGNRVNTEQIVLNLVVNAIHALDETGNPEKVIRVGLSQDNGMACLTVEDNGPGVPEDMRDKLFDPFFTTKKHRQGMGLGLAIVKRFVEEFGGQVKVLSARSGGAVFRIEIPVSSMTKNGQE